MRPVIENSFRAGRDVLAVVFSSALSGTASSFSVAASSLVEEYPERRALVLDSMGGSMGEGLLVGYLLQRADGGASLDETYAYGETLKRHIQHLFTVEDLEFLKRGGRISPAVAVVGNSSKSSPSCTPPPRARSAPSPKSWAENGRWKRSPTKRCAAPSFRTPIPYSSPTGTAKRDAKRMEALLRERFGQNRRILINYMDPVMGAHGGPGILAVFFKGKLRNDPSAGPRIGIICFFQTAKNERFSARFSFISYLVAPNSPNTGKEMPDHFPSEGT